MKLRQFHIRPALSPCQICGVDKCQRPPHLQPAPEQVSQHREDLGVDGLIVLIIGEQESQAIAG